MRIFKHLKSEWFHYGFETIAVIVGILVAFALDNWHEQRKSNEQEISLLKELVENLESDCLQYEQRIKSQEDLIAGIDRLIDHLEAKRPYEDSLKIIMMQISWFEEFSVNRSAYESLKSVGIERLSSTDLKKAITHHYDVLVTNISGIIQNVVSAEATGLQEFFLNNFRITPTGIIPTNYSVLIQEPFYISYLYSVLSWKNDYITMQTQLSEASRSLIDLIQKELETRK